jgi:peroxiredoxin
MSEYGITLGNEIGRRIMRKRLLSIKIGIASCLLVMQCFVTSCATTITPEVEEGGFDWSQVSKIAVVSVSDLERSHEIGKALAHNLFEDGIPFVSKETESISDIYNAAREAKAEVLVYGMVTKIETTISSTTYPPTTIKDVVIELRFIETGTQTDIWKGTGSRADSANMKDEFIINTLVSQMADKAIPVWERLPRAPVGIPMLEIGAEAPLFEVVDIKGSRYALKDEIGKNVVVLSFWSFFCEPCKRTLRTLNDTYRRYRLSGVSVVAVSLEGEPMLTRIKSHVFHDRLEYTFLLDEPEGDSYAIADPYLVPGTPSLYIIDKEGKIAFARAGSISAEDLSAVIEGEIAK